MEDFIMSMSKIHMPKGSFTFQFACEKNEPLLLFFLFKKLM